MQVDTIPNCEALRSGISFYYHYYYYYYYYYYLYIINNAYNNNNTNYYYYYLGSIATNFRPITCLPLIWKLLTGILADELYQHLDSKELLPEEQKDAAGMQGEQKINC